MQAFTVELYYNTELMDQVLSEAGIELGDDYQLTQDEFQTMVETAAGMDIVPIVQGIGDRPYPGSYLVHELLLRKLGREDYAKLWHGKLSFLDERVVDVFEYVQELVEAGAYPRTFTTMRLGESHVYFHTSPGGLTFPLAAGIPAAPSTRRTPAASPRASRSASCSSRPWTTVPARTARPSAWPGPMRSMPPAKTRSWQGPFSRSSRAPRWAPCGSRTPTSRPA
jgi:hypothetical protein